ncbi:(R)-specific enoyl-CoA hydratase [Oceanobacillus picturae]|jgi:3-hydroxybutyryl-CoA dehydratase|uniref:(R)-specific enoyl-CoA hydratase n=1 Tax=Oceanobacillus picturae TaxID=171693 RepID=A0A0U9H8B0_9BACI|nr:MaoC/PaaZ C-terminal domain-containing protein [Oceanobacillus picturae]RIU93759.1 enoyl-CoA hydratase [Oceanobacillus picturae]GAQ18917.1 (R)-specific enoyl-CoA hydratase [Oceanobacillus picturae]
MLGKKRKLGMTLKDIQIGETYTAIKVIEDKELLLYLGLTNDANPLYIQHDYASQTPYKAPIVPSVLLFGMVSSIVSMHLPGPGSHITQHEMAFPKPVLHQTEVRFNLEVIAIDEKDHTVSINVTGYDVDGDKVIIGKLQVCPPYKPNSLTATSLENFF